MRNSVLGIATGFFEEEIMGVYSRLPPTIAAEATLDIFQQFLHNFLHELPRYSLQSFLQKKVFFFLILN